MQAPQVSEEFDVSGHYLLHEQHALARAAQRSREADARNRSQLLKRDSEAVTGPGWRHPSRQRAVAMAAPLGGLVAVVLVAAGAMP